MLDQPFLQPTVANIVLVTVGVLYALVGFAMYIICQMLGGRRWEAGLWALFWPVYALIFCWNWLLGLYGDD